jgi:integrase
LAKRKINLQHVLHLISKDRKSFVQNSYKIFRVAQPASKILQVAANAFKIVRLGGEMAKHQGLDEATIRAGLIQAKASGTIVVVSDAGRTPGLQLVITGKGTATWSLKFTPKGEAKVKRVKLGRHRQGFGLVQARLEAGVLRDGIAKGGNPAIEREQAAIRRREALAAAKAEEAARKLASEAADRRITVKQLHVLYFDARGKDPGMTRMKQMIEFSVLPLLGTAVVETLRKSDVQRLMDDVKARGNATQCHRVLEAFRPMLKWAIDREYLRAEKQLIWRELAMPPKGDARERYLTAAEIAWLWNQCDQWNVTDPNRARIVRLDILLGQRSTETCEIELSELAADVMTWTIPGTKTKNGKPHVVPLPPLARSIIRTAVENAKAEGEAAKEKGDTDTPRGQFLFVGSRGAVARADDVAHDIASAILTWNEAHPQQPVDHFTAHDLRRTMATRLEETGTPMAVIEACLNHISGKSGSVTKKHYAHADKTMPVRHALAKWQGLVEQCISGGDPFAIRTEDIHAVEARALAEARGGRPNLAIVS